MRLTFKVKKLMEEKGVSQKEIASITGLSPTTVSKVVRNQIDRIDRNTVEILCKYFEISSINDFFELIPE
jgi:putative transcriptional regulator